MKPEDIVPGTYWVCMVLGPNEVYTGECEASPVGAFSVNYLLRLPGDTHYRSVMLRKGFAECARLITPFEQPKHMVLPIITKWAEENIDVVRVIMRAAMESYATDRPTFNNRSFTRR